MRGDLTMDTLYTPKEKLEDSIQMAHIRYFPMIKNLFDRPGYTSNVFKDNSIDNEILKSIAYGELFLKEYNVCSKDKNDDGYHARVIACYIVSNSIISFLKEDVNDDKSTDKYDSNESRLEYELKPNRYLFLKNSTSIKNKQSMQFLLDDFLIYQRNENISSYNEFYQNIKDYFILLSKACEEKISVFDRKYIDLSKRAIDNSGIEGISLENFDFLNDLKYDSFDDVFGNEKTIQSIKKICNSLLHYFPSLKKNPYPVPSTIIFSGEPGTGKTMVARAMINYLSTYSKALNKQFTVRFIDQTIKDRYYGESEKMLKEAFRDVKNQNGIGLLVVDEADTIFPPISYSKGVLETSLVGLLLNELDGIKKSQRNNFTSVFITNRPYAGIIEALHSRAKEFIFEKFKEENAYNLQIRNYLLGLGFESFEDFDLENISKACLEFGLSGRDLKNILDGLFYEKSDVSLDNLFENKNYSELKYNSTQDFLKIRSEEFIEEIKSFYSDKEKLKDNEISERIKNISESILCQEMGYKIAAKELNSNNIEQ